MKVGIVGLGLMGGSMAKSIKNRSGHTVYGIDLDQETMMLARMCGAIDGPLDGQCQGCCNLCYKMTLKRMIPACTKQQKKNNKKILNF